MELKGTFVQQLESKTGEGRNGPWIKREFIMQTAGQYAKQVCVQVFGDKGDVIDGLASGEDLTVSFELESREYNNRWYTSVNAWKIDITRTGASSGGSAPKPAANPGRPIPAAAPPTEEEINDLPF